MKANDKLTSIIITCAGTLALTVASPAAIFHVAEGGNIQQAINDAADSPGADTVLIAPGAYVGAFVIEDVHSLTLRGGGEIGDVTIDGDAEDEDVIKVEGGNVTIQNVVITGITDDEGDPIGDDGIDASDGTSLTLIDVEVAGNGDRGVEADDMGSVTIRNSNFYGNLGDGIKVETAHSLLILDVSSTGNGDEGVQAEEIDRVRIQNSDFCENGDDGIFVGLANSLLITNVYSSGSEDGDGIDLEEIRSITIRDITANDNDDEGLEVDDSGTILVTGGIFNINEGEGIDIDNTPNITLTYVNCIGNDGAGFQSVADEVDVRVITVVAGVFEDNGGNGLEFLQDDGFVIGKVTLNGVDTISNGESGLYIPAADKRVTLVRFFSDANDDIDVLP